MLSRISLFALVVLAVLASSTSTPATSPISSASQCNAGNLQCCNALERSDGSVVGILLGLLGVVLQGVEALVGINCSPIDILGIGQGACHSMPVCCQNNNFNGLIAIGCVPIIISL